jgi:hypothetical protein
MRFTCLGKAALATIIGVGAATAALWAFIAVTAGREPAEDFDLAGWAAITVTLSLVVIIIVIVVRDSIRDTLISHMRATLHAGETPGRPRLVPVPDRDAG